MSKIENGMTFIGASGMGVLLAELMHADFPPYIVLAAVIAFASATIYKIAKSDRGSEFDTDLLKP